MTSGSFHHNSIRLCRILRLSTLFWCIICLNVMLRPEKMFSTYYFLGSFTHMVKCNTCWNSPNKEMPLFTLGLNFMSALDYKTVEDFKLWFDVFCLIKCGFQSIEGGSPGLHGAGTSRDNTRGKLQEHSMGGPCDPPCLPSYCHKWLFRGLWVPAWLPEARSCHICNNHSGQQTGTSRDTPRIKLQKAVGDALWLKHRHGSTDEERQEQIVCILCLNVVLRKCPQQTDYFCGFIHSFGEFNTCCI